jgi:glycosyltransferase involved in cell wall biosynthesis
MPDCVDTDFFRPRSATEQIDVDTIKDQLGIPRDRTVVIYLGLLAHYQGTGHIVQAAQKVIAARPNTHFLIMGYPGFNEYYNLAWQLGVSDHMTFTGRVPYEHAARFLHVGDIALAPKLSLTEAAGKILNYMACALPTVAFDTPQAHEYMAQFGVYADRGDANSLADRIIELLQDPDRAYLLGQALRARAISGFSWDDAVRHILAVYDAVRAPRPELCAAALHQLLEGEHAHEPR